MYVLSTGQYVPTVGLVVAIIDMNQPMSHIVRPGHDSFLRLKHKNQVEVWSVSLCFRFSKPDNVTSLPFMGGYVAWSGVDYLTILP